jgi:hypothetical protein
MKIKNLKKLKCEINLQIMIGTRVTMKNICSKASILITFNPKKEKNFDENLFSNLKRKIKISTKETQPVIISHIKEKKYIIYFSANLNFCFQI